MDAVQKANSGHPGMPLGAAPMAFALWSRFLNVCPAHPTWFNRDRFILSAGHGSMLQYALLYLAGFNVSLEDLKNFRQLGSKTPGHPENHVTEGVEMATGPLGQGISTAVGMAMAERFLAAKFNRPGFDVVDHWTYVICSDGDLMEGISQEAGSLAGHQRLGKLIALYDSNGITIDGSTDLAFTENVGARYEALGWHVQYCDGMAVDTVSDAIAAARADDRPSLIVAKTVIGFGSPNKAGSEKSHGSPLGVDEVRLTKEALGIPTEEDFWVAPEAHECFAAWRDDRLARMRNWEDVVAQYKSAYPELASEFDSVIRNDFSGVDWYASLPSFSEPIATRKASHQTIQHFGSVSTLFMGGSADLAESNFTTIKDTLPMQAATPEGRNIPFGVREHGMAAAVNGLNLHGGVRAFGATFLIFSDYCRPSIRLAALMGCPSIFAFTHDSIGVGEDGPTHQPIEQTMSLRLIPNLWVMRPADGNEAAVCWAMAMERTSGPTALCLTRQNLAACTPLPNAEHPARRGGYVLKESDAASVSLIATGSEVNLALRVAEALENEGISARVVNLPCWQVFEEQDSSYKSNVLGQTKLNVSIEAGTTLGWTRYANLTIGIDTFGSSGTGDQLMRHYGFSVDAILPKIKAELEATISNSSAD